MRNSNYIVIFFFSLLFISCDANGVFDTYKSLPKTWHKDEAVSFTLKNIDTSKTYNLFVNLRNNNQYKYSNLFLIISMEYPHGKTLKDTLEYKMAKPSGEFLGTGFSSIKENKLWYKEAFQFKEIGEYQIDIQQAMRENGKVDGVQELQGITDVGFRVELAQNK